MRTMVTIFSCLAAGLLAIGCHKPTPGRSAQEPMYQGRLLSEWARDSVSTTSPGGREPACQAIRQIGTNALPFLLAEHIALYEKFQEAGLANFASSREAIDRRFNIDAIEDALGPMAKPLAPALVSLIKEGKDPAFIAARSLARVDPITADPLFAELLTNKSWNTRACIAGEVSSLGTNAFLSMPALFQCLRSETNDNENSTTVKMCILTSLQRTGSHSDQAVESFRDCLKDKNEVIRLLAVQSLRKLGADAQPAIPDLRQMSTNDPAPHVRVNAQQALEAIGAGQGVSPTKP